MSSASPSKQLASVSIEELLEQPNHQHQNWLLTYLDVFVLIIMLVLTLLALSEFEKEQKMEKQQSKSSTKSTAKQQKLIIKETPIIKPQKPLPIKEVLIFKQQQPQPIKEIDKPSFVIKEKTIEKLNPTDQEEQTDKKNFATNVPTTSNQQPQPIKITEEPLIIEKKHVETIDTKEHKEAEPKQLIQQSENKLQQQLKKTIEDLGLIDAVNMKVSLGYAQLEIQDKILFKSSESSLLLAGEELLKKLAPLLEQSAGLIYIEGHTDNRPIKTLKFPSNWELGASRATSVLHYLTSQNLDSSRLRAITYGDTKPISDNSTIEGRERNRRVSLVIKVSDKID